MLRNVNDKNVGEIHKKQVEFVDKYSIIRSISKICIQYNNINLINNNDKKEILSKMYSLNYQSGIITKEVSRSHVYTGVFIFFNYNYLCLSKLDCVELNNFFRKNFQVNNLYLNCNTFNKYLQEARKEILTVNASNYLNKNIHEYTDAFFSVLIKSFSKENNSLNSNNNFTENIDLKQKKISNFSTSDESPYLFSKISFQNNIFLINNHSQKSDEDISSNYLGNCGDHDILVIEDKVTKGVYAVKGDKKILLWNNNTRSI